VATESVNPSLVPGAAGERRIAEMVADWCAQSGLETVLEGPEERPSVVALARGTRGGRSLMLNAHLDTAGAGEMTRPFTPWIAGTRLYGRGAYDMKGALAAILLATAEAKRAELPGDVIVTAVADEEHSSAGTRGIVRRFTADGAILAEATELDVCVAHEGFAWLVVETRGREEEDPRPELQATATMQEVIARLQELERRTAERRHPLLGQASLNASLITGGRGQGHSNDRLALALERRTLPGEDPAEHEAEIRSLLRGIDAEVRTTQTRPPFEVDPAEPLVAALRRGVAAVTGQEPSLVGKKHWMDAAILASAGIPTVIFGPTGAGAHQKEEWVDLESVAACAAVLLATAREFCT
jgi:acetylornithine deacetylase